MRNQRVRMRYQRLEKLCDRAARASAVTVAAALVSVPTLTSKPTRRLSGSSKAGARLDSLAALLRWAPLARDERNVQAVHLRG